MVLILLVLFIFSSKKLNHRNSVSSQSASGKSSIARKPEDHPKCFNWKKTFQKCNPPDFKFYPSKLTNKHFPIWRDVKFSFFFFFFVLLNAVNTDTKLTLHHMGIWGTFLLFNLPRWNLKSGGLHFFFLPFKMCGMDFRFSRNRRFATCALRWDSLAEIGAEMSRPI